MERTNKPPDTKIIEFLATEDSVERQLVCWIRDLVDTSWSVVSTLERLRNSYRLLRANKPVTEAEEILWRVEQCLKDAELSSLLGLAWLRGRRGAQSPPRGPDGTPA
jgi:hypothetical protein